MFEPIFLLLIMDRKIIETDEEIIIIPQDLEGRHYMVYLISKHEEFRINIFMKTPDNLKESRFSCDWKLRQLIRGYEEVLKKRCEQCENLFEFMQEIKTLVDNLSSFESPGEAKLHPEVYSRVLKEVEAIGWQNEDFDAIKATIRDDGNRDHLVAFNLKHREAGMEFTYCADLPVNEYEQKDDTMSEVYQHLCQIVEKCQLFWNTMSEIDQKCWVLEPETSTHSCCYRRIALGQSASIRIALDPLHPVTIPECRFLGPAHVIDPLKEKWNGNLSNWNDGDSLLGNLRNTLEIELPSACNTEKEKIQVHCGICYSYRLDGKIPEHTCNDIRCGQTYHKSCLVEWLRSLPSCRQSFNVVFGECPYCEKKITVQVGGS